MRYKTTTNRHLESTPFELACPEDKVRCRWCSPTLTYQQRNLPAVVEPVPEQVEHCVPYRIGKLSARCCDVGNGLVKFCTNLGGQKVFPCIDCCMQPPRNCFEWSRSRKRRWWWLGSTPTSHTPQLQRCRYMAKQHHRTLPSRVGAPPMRNTHHRTNHRINTRALIPQ
jgi:hypothetical protein